ncbi:hypothetical protein H6P81_000277 [Aristolochia fimbriata]|uniref:Nuclear pore complex protein NUP1 n=1 Tax=Aristolochia fimbriata TaxID=158543 RepID=A0AAV7F539_ARIFI|nr:hypothetical protein H6P81_000277 [Aristolochia fimbriata]
MAGEGAREEAGASYGGRGVGGKLQTRTHRRPPSTPYDRPAARRKDGWISKFVNPASRLATRFFPSFFSKPDDSVTVDGTDNSNNPELEPSCGDARYNSDNNSAEERSLTPVDVANVSSSRTDLDQEKRADSISEIEQFLQQKTFSRAEFIQLTELLRSRTADLSTDHEHLTRHPDVEHSTKDPDDTKELNHEEFRSPLQEKQVQPFCHRIEKTSSPLLESAEHEETSSSPVEIAKAFMGTRKSEPLSALQNVMLKESNTPNHDNVSSLLPPPSVESPVCWPGAVIQDVPEYLTPQAQRGRIGLHNLPRTPYSRPSKFQGVGERPLNLSSTRLRQQQTPIFGSHQVPKRRNYRVDDDFATVGPVRRKRQLSTDIATPKRDSFSHVIRSSTSRRANFHAFPSSSDFLEREPASTLERSGFLKSSEISKSAIGSASVHPQSSKMAQRILEHLDRAVTSPKEKLEELSLVRARGSGTANSLTDVPRWQPKETVNKEKGPLSVSPEGQNLEQASGVGDADISTFKINTPVLSSGSFNTGFGRKPLEPFQEVHDLQTSSHEDVGRKLSSNQVDYKNSLSSLQNQSTLQMQKPLSISKRPELTSISVAKRDGKQNFSSDGAFCFTFPVSSASGGSAICEPPTPTIVPALASKASQAKEESAIPSFSFTSSSTKKSLSFSFGSTLNSSALDASVPKFSFGSENNKAKISFSAVGAAFAPVTKETLAEPST